MKIKLYSFCDSLKMESSYSLKKLRELAGNEVNIYTNENSTESLTNIRKNASFERQSDVNDIGELIIATTKYPTAIIPEVSGYIK